MKSLLIRIIKLYQGYSKRNGRRSCRFYPTCSQYALEALEKYGFIKGVALSTKRVLKCHPFHPGGYDPLL